MAGWIDVVTQLRDLSPSRLIQLENSLVLNEVSAVVSAGFSPSRDSMRLTFSNAARGIKIYHGWGLHPFAHIEIKSDRWHQEIECLQPDFIGEVGLDKRCLDAIDWQAQVERAQIGIDLAEAFKLPLLWHSVQATQRAMALVKGASRRGVRGIWHNFHGSVETAKELVDVGWKLGVGPAFLKPNAHRLRNTLRALPVASLVLESDWPQPHGDYSLRLVGEGLANFVDVPIEHLKSQLEENFFDLLR